MSIKHKLSLRKGSGSKGKSQHELETSFDGSGSSTTVGVGHATPSNFVASRTRAVSPGLQASGGHISLPGSLASDSLVKSPLSPPLSLSEDLQSPDSSDGATAMALSKSERKRLEKERAEKRKKEKEKVEAESKVEERRERDRQETERKRKKEQEKQEAKRKVEEKREKEKEKKKKEEKDKKFKGKKSDAISPQDEMSASSEDFLGSSTLVTAPSAATPGAEHSVNLSLRDKSGGWSEVVQKPKHTASGVNIHGSSSGTPMTVLSYESEPNSKSSSSFDAGKFEEDRQSYLNAIDDLEHDLEKEKEASKKAKDKFERELSEKNAELQRLTFTKGRELQEALDEQDRRKREEWQRKERELKQKEEDLQVAMLAKVEEYRRMLNEQMEVKQRELDQKQKENATLQARLQEKGRESAAASIVLKQEGEVHKLRKELEDKRQDMELQTKQHEIALSNQRDHLQALILRKERERKKSASDSKEAVQTWESLLQNVREELKQKTKELEAQKTVHQDLLQTSTRNEQQLRDVQAQLDEHKQQHTKDMELVKEHQGLIRRMKTDHQTELRNVREQKDKDLQEALLQGEQESGDRIAELEAAQAEYVRELKAKDARVQRLEAERQRRKREVLDQSGKDRELREVLQQRGGESQGKIAELEAAQARLVQELERKNARIQHLEAEGKRRHEEVLDESKKERELQMRIQEMEKQHREELEEKNRQYQKAIDEMQRTQGNALEMQKARIERKVEKEQAKKQQENLDRARAELQRKVEVDADKVKAGLQLKETEFQAAMQRRDRESEARIAELKDRHAQELVSKNLRIHQLEEEVAQIMPSFDPVDEAPSGAVVEESRRISVESREAHMDDLPSNVIDLAREISHFVDPENIIPQGKLTRELSPNELCHVTQAIGSPALLGAQKPPSFLFAVLPATNKMRSTLFDYTGCFGGTGEEQPTSLPYQTPEGSPQSSMRSSMHGSSFQEIPNPSQLLSAQMSQPLSSLEASTCPLPSPLQREGPELGVTNLSDSDKIERLQSILKDFQRLQADKDKKLQGKTEQVEELSEAIAAREQSIEDLSAKVDELSSKVRDHSAKVQERDAQVRDLSQVIAEREQDVEDLNAKIDDLSTKFKEHSTGCKAKIEELSQTIAESEQTVEELTAKVEERDSQIESLRKGGRASALSPKAQAEFDQYFEQVVKLTEKATDYEARMKKQEREMDRLKRLEGNVEGYEEQALQAGSQLSEQEEAIKSKDEEILKLQRQLQEITSGQGLQVLQDEIDTLRPLQAEVEQLRAKCKDQPRVVQLQTEIGRLQPLEQECEKLRSELETAKNDIIALNARSAIQQAHQMRIEAEGMQKEHDTIVKELDRPRGKALHPGRSAAEPKHVQALELKVQQLEDKLQARDEEIFQLREENNPSLRMDPAALQRLQSSSDGAAVTEVAQLQEILVKREQKIHNLEQQVRSFESIIKDREHLQGHTKEQSRAVFHLRQQLEAKEKQTQEGCGEVVATFEQTKEELKQVKEERDSALAKIQQLQNDLSTAGEKTVVKLQLLTAREKVDKLEQENQELEMTVQQLQTQLDLTKANAADQEAQVVHRDEGIEAMQLALSDSEHHRQSLNMKYFKEKETREKAEQRSIEMMVANEELGRRLSDMESEVAGVKTEAQAWKHTIAEQIKTLNGLKQEVERENEGLKGDVERLMRENEDLRGEVEARRQEAEIIKQDFGSERHDRTQAAHHYDDEKAKSSVEMQKLSDEVQRCHREVDVYKSEVDKLKGELSRRGELEVNFEALQMELVNHREQAEQHKARQAALKAEVEESRHQLEENIANTAKLHDEVLAKTQQVKQYKKQVDGYKGQVKEMKAEMDGLKTELGVYQQQLTGAQQMAADMDTLRQQRDSLASQLQQLKGRKSSESEFATAFQSEFDKRNELERKNTEVREHCEWLYQENERLKAILQQHSIACPDQLQHPARARIVPTGPVMPRSPGDQQRPLGHATPQQMVRPPPHSGPPQHQLQYPEQQYAQQGHLYQPPTSAVQTATPQHQVGLQQRPVPGPQHQLQYPEQQYAQQGHLYQPPTSAVQTATPQHLQQRPVPGPSQQPINVAAVRHQQAHSVAQQQQQEVEQRALAYAQEKLQQQQQLEQQRQREAVKQAQEREQLQQQQLLEQELHTQALAQSAALKHAQERRMQQQMQQQQQTEVYRKQKGTPLKAQMKAYSVDDPRYAHGQPRGGVPQPQVHEGSQVPRSNQSTVPSTGPNAQGNRLLPNRAQMEPNTLRPQNGSQQNFAPHNYQVPQHQGYPPPQGDYDPHHQHSSLPSSINSIGVRHTADQALHMQDGNNLSASTLAGQPGQRPRSGFVHSHADQQYLQQGVATNAAPNQFQSPHDHSPIVRAHIAPPSQQPPRERKPQQPNAAFPRSNESPFSQTPVVSQAPRGHVREIQAGAPIVVPMQATNADIDAQERVSVPTQESNPDLPQQQAGLKQSAQDPKESLDKELMKGLQGDIRGAAEGVKAATERESSASAADGTIPLDPNLICPYCNKNFRIGEIQIFRRHVSSCTGT